MSDNELGFMSIAESSARMGKGELSPVELVDALIARAERLDVDSQGRMRIPERLKTFAELKREVVLLGVSDHLELWGKARWEEYVAKLTPQFDEIAEQAYED